jgi:L-ascorbate metabolism protein UlaG (beta-lactamase superfamily)
MEIQFHGANCVSLSGKKFNVVVDDNLESLGGKSVAKPGDIVLQTFDQTQPKAEAKIVITAPGEYEVSNVSIRGVSARAHMDEEGKKSAVIYSLIIDDIRVAIVGHIYPSLNEEQMEIIGTVDVLLVPVGGNGYTLDPIGAQKVIKLLEPKLVIPTHYGDKSLSFEVPQQPLEEALKTMNMEPKESVDKLKLKSGEIGELTHLIVVNKS